MDTRSQFLCPGARNPGRPDVFNAVLDGADRLVQQMTRLKPDDLPISEYNRKYLGRYLAQPFRSLQHYVRLVTQAISVHSEPLSKISFVDFGGGCGLMSLLARSSGIGTVLYNDIYDVSCKDARIVAERLGLAADAYIEGDVARIHSEVTRRNIPVDAFVSNNVIEHVYNIHSHLREVANLPGPRLVIHLETSANVCNPRTRKLTMELQRRKETVDTVPGPGWKKRDANRAYLPIRKELIQEKFPSLAAAVVSDLAARTRGLHEADIQAAVSKYVETGQLPQFPKHPTNTCDPLTGNRSEELMDPRELAATLQSFGFKTDVWPGVYPQTGNRMKNVLENTLNRIIGLSPAIGLKLAPSYIIHARRSAP